MLCSVGCYIHIIHSHIYTHIWTQNQHHASGNREFQKALLGSTENDTDFITYQTATLLLFLFLFSFPCLRSLLSEFFNSLLLWGFFLSFQKRISANILEQVRHEHNPTEDSLIYIPIKQLLLLQDEHRPLPTLAKKIPTASTHHIT